MKIREEYHLRRATLPTVEDTVCNADTYDLALRFSTDGKLALCNQELPHVLATASAAIDEPVSVVYTGRGFRASVRVKGAVAKGSKLTTNTVGQIIQSGTSESAVLASTDFAIALSDASDGQECEVDVLR